MKTRHTLSRRQFAQATLTGAAALLLTASVQAGEVPVPVDVSPIPLPLPSAKAPSEGDFLTRMVPINVGYALTPTQAKETAAQLKDYPGGFAKARAYVVPDDVEPAFAANAPIRKERAK